MQKLLFSSLWLGLAAAATSLHAQVTFTDDFSAPAFDPGWVQYNNPGGSWELETHATYGPIARPYLGTNPPPAGYTLDKVLSYEGITLDNAFSASVDLVGLNQRWAGMAFHIQGGNPATDENKISYYSLIANIHNSNSAIQIRRYDDGALTAFNSYTVVPDPHIGPNQFLRFSVSSEEEGVFLLSVDRLDNDTREVLSSAGSFTFTDPGAPLTGGYAGLHSNSNEMGYTSFDVAVIPEPATVAFLLSGAVLLFAVARRRFRRLDAQE